MRKRTKGKRRPPISTVKNDKNHHNQRISNGNKIHISVGLPQRQQVPSSHFQANPQLGSMPQLVQPYQPNMLFPNLQPTVLPQMRQPDPIFNRIQHDQSQMSKVDPAPFEIKPPVNSSQIPEKQISEPLPDDDVIFPDEVVKKKKIRKDLIPPPEFEEDEKEPEQGPKPRRGRPVKPPVRVREPPREITTLTREQLEKIKTTTGLVEKIEGLGYAVPSSVNTKAKLIDYYLKIAQSL